MPRIMQQQYYCMVNLHSLILVKVPRSQIPKKCELVPFTLSLAFALVHAPGPAPAGWCSWAQARGTIPTKSIGQTSPIGLLAQAPKENPHLAAGA